jgi:subtilase family serine protease
MGLARKTAIAVSACGLVAGMAGTAALTSGVAAGAAAGSVSASAAAVEGVAVHPNAVRVGTTQSGGPTTTAQCEKKFHVACYTVAQLRQAYDLPALYAKGITGKGTTIAIVDSFGSPTIRHDLGMFDKAFHLPAPPSFRIIQPAGKVPPYSKKNGGMVGWAGETTLDVEWAHAVAPGANILLVETPVNETEGTQGFPQIVKAEEYVLKHYHVDVISQSFSATEQSFNSEGGRNAIESLRGAILAADADHVTMLAASGDGGAANSTLSGSTNYTYPTVNWETSDPLVTGVGGTQLHLNAAGDHTQPDSVWNDTYNKATEEFTCGAVGPCPLASGGGKSVFFSRPSYQDGVADVTGNARGVPDISMSAACNGAVDLYVSFPGAPVGWGQECGTSEATPEFAGIVALAAQYAGHSLGLINPALYQMSEAGDRGIVPVTSGNNTVTFKQNKRWYTVHGFHAHRVYSLAAGVGTVNAYYFVPELAALAG